MSLYIRCVFSGAVAIFQPLISSVWPEGLRLELERDLFSSSRYRRVLLSSASSPSPERLSGREAVRHVTNVNCDWSTFLNFSAKFQCVELFHQSLWRRARRRQFSEVNFDFFKSLYTDNDVDATLSNDKTDSAHLVEQYHRFFCLLVRFAPVITYRCLK